MAKGCLASCDLAPLSPWSSKAKVDFDTGRSDNAGMNTKSAILIAVVAGSLAVLGGCLGPNYEHVANDLRDRNLKQEQEIARLKEQLANDAATRAELESRLEQNSPRIQTLKPERLAELFTAARIQIRPQTDAWDFQGGPGLDGYRVFLRVLTAKDQVIPATGTLTIEAFDLALEGHDETQRIGTWSFTPAEMKKSWYSELGMNYFAFNCPWVTPPAHADITFKAKFVDALTGSVMVDQMHKTLKLDGDFAAKAK